jgi:hypothetical protein
MPSGDQTTAITTAGTAMQYSLNTIPIILNAFLPDYPSATSDFEVACRN